MVSDSLPDMVSDSSPDAEMSTPPAVAKRYRVSADKIIRWIEAGEIQALNVAQKLGGRPRYRITAKALADFERKRSTSPTPKPSRRRKQSAGIISFY